MYLDYYNCTCTSCCVGGFIILFLSICIYDGSKALWIHWFDIFLLSLHICRDFYKDKLSQISTIGNWKSCQASSNFPHTCSPFFVITLHPLSLLTLLNFWFKCVKSAYYFYKLRENFFNFQLSMSKWVYLYKNLWFQLRRIRKQEAIYQS